MKKKVSIFLFLLISSVTFATEYKVGGVSTVLNVRMCPSTDCEIIDKLSNGDVVRFVCEEEPEAAVEKDETWIKIEHNGREGWVSSKYLGKVDGNNDNSSFFSTIINGLDSIWQWYVKIFWSDDNLLLCIVGLAIALAVIAGIICLLFYFFHVALYGLIIYLALLFFLWLLVQAGLISYNSMYTIAPWGFPLGCVLGIYLSIKDPDEFYGPSGSNITIVGSDGHPIHQNVDGTWQDKDGYMYDKNGDPVTDNYGSHLSR